MTHRKFTTSLSKCGSELLLTESKEHGDSKMKIKVDLNAAVAAVDLSGDLNIELEIEFIVKVKTTPKVRVASQQASLQMSEFDPLGGQLAEPNPFLGKPGAAQNSKTASSLSNPLQPMSQAELGKSTDEAKSKLIQASNEAKSLDQSWETDSLQGLFGNISLETFVDPSLTDDLFGKLRLGPQNGLESVNLAAAKQANVASNPTNAASNQLSVANLIVSNQRNAASGEFNPSSSLDVSSLDASSLDAPRVSNQLNASSNPPNASNTLVTPEASPKRIQERLRGVPNLPARQEPYLVSHVYKSSLDRFTSWIGLYKLHFQGLHDCKVEGCDKPARVGAHVYEKSTGVANYIVPMCDWHNLMKAYDAVQGMGSAFLKTKPNTHLLGMLQSEAVTRAQNHYVLHLQGDYKNDSKFLRNIQDIDALQGRNYILFVVSRSLACKRAEEYLDRLAPQDGVGFYLVVCDSGCSRVSRFPTILLKERQGFKDVTSQVCDR